MHVFLKFSQVKLLHNTADPEEFCPGSIFSFLSRELFIYLFTF